jgi:cytochrome c oxidase subunit 2
MLDWLPENVSSIGDDIDFLFSIIYYITTGALVVVFSFLLFCLIRYRRRPGAQARYTTGHTGLELIWTGITLVIMVGLALLSRPLWSTIKENSRPPSPDRVFARVTGKQFNWIIRYPGADGRFDTPDDIADENALHIPVDTDIWLVLRSEDVIHGFFVPALRLKQDAVPGRDIPVWLRAVKTGVYELACAELCGFGHTTMRGQVNILSRDAFETWYKNRLPAETAP